MSVISVTIPNAKVAAQSGNGTRQKLLPIMNECKPCNMETSNECPACENDTPTSNFTTCEGSLFLQFFITDNFNPNPAVPVAGWGTWLKLNIVTPTTTYAIAAMADVCVNWWVSYANGQSVQLLELDMAKVCELLGAEKCFYLQIDICHRVPGPTMFSPMICQAALPAHPRVGDTVFDPIAHVLYQYTVTGWVAVVIPANSYVWCRQGGTYYVFDGESWTTTQTPPARDQTVCEPGCFTEVYKIQNCEELLHFKSIFTTYDCLGFYYGIPAPFVGSAAVPFEMDFYIRGSLETQSFPVEETKSEDDSLVLSKKLSESALLRTWGITKYQAKKIANVFMGETWTVNDETWDSTKEVSKNNDQGENWYPALELTRELCEKSTTACDE